MPNVWYTYLGFHYNSGEVYDDTLYSPNFGSMVIEFRVFDRIKKKIVFSTLMSADVIDLKVTVKM